MLASEVQPDKVHIGTGTGQRCLTGATVHR